MERIYTIPLRKESQKAPIYKRTMKAVKATREFLQKHMKNPIVKIGRYLNMELNSRGRKNPPHKVKVKVWTEKVKIKDKEIEIVKAELFGAPEERLEQKEVKETKEEPKAEEKKESQEALKEEIKKAEEKPLEKKESKKPKAPRIEEKKPFDTKRTTRAAPHKAQIEKFGKKK
ncbi:MAG: hypothetical protein AABW87_01735 [Nanoarchaeota archaeon]